MFLDLATEAGELDWSVIRGFVLLSLFEDRCGVSYPPVPWNCSGVEVFLENRCQEKGRSHYLTIGSICQTLKVTIASDLLARLDVMFSCVKYLNSGCMAFNANYFIHVLM